MFCKQLVSSLLLAVAISGCGLFSDSTDLEFAYRESSPGQTVEASFDASAISSGQIVFVGQLNTPNPCYRLEGKLSENGRQLTLDISAERSGSTTCETIVGRFIYEGAIQNLSAGTYDVTVRHRYDQTGWPTKEFKVTSLNVK